MAQPAWKKIQAGISSVGVPCGAQHLLMHERNLQSNFGMP